MNTKSRYVRGCTSSIAAISRTRKSHDRQEELGQFIVHDLRSPLANVMTGLQVLQEDADETMDPLQEDMIEMCLVSCNRMLTLINSLLDLAQLESGEMPHLAGERNRQRHDRHLYLACDKTP